MKITIMKQFNKLRALFSVVAIIMVFTTVNINSAYGQNTTSSASATPTATPSPEPTPYKRELKHTKAKRDALKATIADVFATVEDASNTIIPVNPTGRKRMEDAKDKLSKFTDEDLDLLADSLDPAELELDLQDAKDKLERIKPGMRAAYEQGDSAFWKSTGADDSARSELAGIADPNAVCKALIGMGKAELHVLAAAKAAYIAAKILSIALDRGCNQIIVAGVVVLGNGGVGGGNSSLACIISDGLLLIADTLHSQVLYCDTDFTRRSVDTAVERMKNVHDDLEITAGKVDATKTAVDATKTAVDGARTDILKNDNDNKKEIMDAMGKNTTTITTAVGDGTTTIVNNDNTNKNFVLRMQIEADLSSTNSATFIAMFLTPVNVCSSVLNDKGESIVGSTQCGYLDYARAIVVQTIANLAGTNKTQANSFLTKGDSYKIAGDYRQAYQNYRLAYKTAAGIK